MLRWPDSDGMDRFIVVSGLPADMWGGKADIGTDDVGVSFGVSRGPRGIFTESWIESTGVISPDSV